MLNCKTILTIGALYLFFVSTNTTAQKLSPDELKFFESKIRPVLVRECYSCHSGQAGQQKGGLMLDTKARCEVGGNTGPAIVPGDLQESLLFNAITYEDFQMPPSHQLPESIIADFREWIEGGAPDPRNNKKQPIQSTVSNKDIEIGRKFWSFRKPKRPRLPIVENQGWVKNAVDRFVLHDLEADGMSPASDADTKSLLRRITFDLTGLPPSSKQISWFETAWESSPDKAIRQMVNELLDSPQFGERWGRHWLDVARYAESTGREINATFPQAWRYRDYVIDAFNRDKPYNEFVREQIAGDLIPAKTDEEWAEHLVATGFLAIGPKSLNERNAKQFQLDLIDEQIDVTTRVFLGVSVACARCHDHKFDPIQQRDYYAMAGIFGSTSTHYGTVDSAQNRRPSNEIILPISDPNPFDQELSRSAIADMKQAIESKRKDQRELQTTLRQARREGKAPPRGITGQINRTVTQIATMERQLNSVDSQGEPISFCMGVQDKSRPVNSRLLIRGEFDQPDKKVPRGLVQVLSRQPLKIPADSSGRKELAMWMSDKDNPLVARVMVNRIWQHLLGEGLVRSPENFGATGQFPSHPDLLDFLSVHFVKKGWSVKEMIRFICSSRTYRMGTHFNSEYFAKDPDNEKLWRANSKQLDAESMRDAMLFVSGKIELERPRASMVAKAGATVARDGNIVGINAKGIADSANMMMQPRSTFRRSVTIYDVDKQEKYRSVYLPIVREGLPRSLEVFDFAEPGLVVGKREQSNTPAQGLYLMNNLFVMQTSEALAKRVIQESSNLESQIESVFKHCYGREVYQSELEAAKSFYNDFQTSRRLVRRGKSEELQRLSALAQAVMISAEFRYIN